MPNIKYRKERKIICQMILDLSRVILEPRVESWGTRMDLLLMLCAIGVGHFQGKPLNTSKVSAWTGIPRVSVIRKLTEMKKLGWIVDGPDKTFRYSQVILYDKAYIQSVVQIVAIIAQAGQELSKLSTTDTVNNADKET